MKRLGSWVILIVGAIFSSIGLAFADKTKECPETLVWDFQQSVANREIAIDIFKKAFPADKGFPEFDEKMLSGPYRDASVPSGSYSYFGWYGHGDKKIGGLLYPDGRLVQRGYCK